MCNFYPGNLSVAEIVLITWVSTLFLEEIRKYFYQPGKTITSKWKGYISNWNIITVAAVFFYYLSLILRLIYNSEGCFKAARVIFAFDCIFWYIKMFCAYRHLRKLGPMLLLIQKIMEELFYFLLIIFLFVFAFGGLYYFFLFFNKGCDYKKYIKKNIIPKLYPTYLKIDLRSQFLFNGILRFNNLIFFLILISYSFNTISSISKSSPRQKPAEKCFLSFIFYNRKRILHETRNYEW